ncbi:hypothetical protein BASA83_006078 [Batrachochytrium salamandrivorans]|nr:hypothetical protein BASA83_006078 [Batrachochytrium salamandrivorans]
MGKAYYGLELVGGNKSHLAPTADNNQQGYPTDSLVPDSRLPLDPFWLKTGIGHFSLAHWSHEYAVGAICYQENTINAICSSTEMTVYTDVQGSCNWPSQVQSGLVPAIQKSRLRLLGRALDPGVENVYTWLRGGVLKWRSRSGPSVGWTGLWSMNLWGRGMIIGRWQHG